MGRRKIKIEKIQNKAYLKATFSKRRKGLFRKAAELCDMSGAEIAILTVSPGKKFYNFGHPDVDSVVARYCGEGTSCRLDVTQDGGSHENLIGEKEKEQACTDEVDLDEFRSSLSITCGEEKEPIDKFWWDEEEPSDAEQRKRFSHSLQELRNNVMRLLNERNMRESYTKDYLSGMDMDISYDK